MEFVFNFPVGKQFRYILKFFCWNLNTFFLEHNFTEKLNILHTTNSRQSINFSALFGEPIFGINALNEW